MAEDMEVVALLLSWRTGRVNSTERCKLDLDKKMDATHPASSAACVTVRRAYEASKKTCKYDLQTGHVVAAKELSTVS